MSAKAEETVALLKAWREGDSAARDRLFARLYADLRRSARRQLAFEAAAYSVSPTVLVHEACARLLGLTRIDWRNKAHILAAGAGEMRRILVDRARARRAAKRDGGARVTLTDTKLATSATDVDLLDLSDALNELAREAPRHVRLVELRFFGGLSIEEAAAVMGISPATANRDWLLARAWLHRRLT